VRIQAVRNYETKKADRAQAFADAGQPFSVNQESRVMTEQARLSLIEVIIIATVLAVASVEVVPRFTEATEKSRTGELIEGLQKMRSQLALYRVQHGDCLPPTCSLNSFKSAITTRTGEFGPYIKGIPVNPYNGFDTVRFDGEPAGANKAGWRLDTKHGSIQADNSAVFAFF
jgi:type II secretory pathway pseudopilin PulG